MDFATKYPQRREFFMATEPEVEPGIIYSGRIFACVECRKPTGFRITALNVPCCSSRCWVAIEPSRGFNIVPSEQPLDIAPSAPKVIPHDQLQPQLEAAIHQYLDILSTPV